MFDENGVAKHEFHVYDKGKEIGVYREGKFIAKHGFTGEVPKGITRPALERLNGLDVDAMRRQGRLPKVRVRGFSKVLRKLPFIGPFLIGGGMVSDPNNAHFTLMESFGTTTMGNGELPFADIDYHDTPQFGESE